MDAEADCPEDEAGQLLLLLLPAVLQQQQGDVIRQLGQLGFGRQQVAQI